VIASRARWLASLILLTAGCDKKSKPAAPKVAASAAKKPVAPIPAPAPVTVPDSIAIVPLLDGVFFPGGHQTLRIGRARSLAAIRQARDHGEYVGILTQRETKTEVPSGDDLYQVGTIATVGEMKSEKEGAFSVTFEGLTRFEVKEWIQADPYLMAEVRQLEQVPLTGDEAEDVGEDLARLKKSLRASLARPGVAPDDIAWVDGLEDPGMAADLAIANSGMPIPRRQQLLGVVSVRARLTEAINAFGPPRLRTRTPR
jgi:ATP-dependent Lon protease